MFFELKPFHFSTASVRYSKFSSLPRFDKTGTKTKNPVTPRSSRRSRSYRISFILFNPAKIEMHWVLKLKKNNPSSPLSRLTNAGQFGLIAPRQMPHEVSQCLHLAVFTTRSKYGYKNRNTLQTILHVPNCFGPTEKTI